MVKARTVGGRVGVNPPNLRSKGVDKPGGKAEARTTSLNRSETGGGKLIVGGRKTRILGKPPALSNALRTQKKKRRGERSMKKTVRKIKKNFTGNHTSNQHRDGSTEKRGRKCNRKTGGRRAWV